MIAKEPIEYGQARRAIQRLGLNPLLAQLLDTIKRCEVLVLKKKEGNGAGDIADKLVGMLKRLKGWREGKKTEGEPDFIACVDYKGVRTCLGVEIQISARSVQVYQDVVHLRTAVRESKIDACVIVINSDDFAYYLPSRVANLREALKYIAETIDPRDLPLLVIPIEHDGFQTKAVPKRRTRH